MNWFSRENSLARTRTQDFWVPGPRMFNDHTTLHLRENVRRPAPLACQSPAPAQRSRREYRDLSSEAGSEQVRCFRGLATKHASKRSCWHSKLVQTLLGMEPCGWRSYWQELAFSLGDFPGESLSAALPLCYH